MEKTDFIRMMGAFQNIHLSEDQAAHMVEPGGMFDMLQMIKTGLFQVDVSGFKPLDELNFLDEGDK